MPDWLLSTPVARPRLRTSSSTFRAAGYGSHQPGIAVVGHVNHQGPVPVEQHSLECRKR